LSWARKRTLLPAAVKRLFIRRHIFTKLSVEIAVKHARIKIISGGQTGVDRAALDFAIRHDYEHGGWCPRERRAEDGSIPSHYELHETGSPDYVERTEQNVLDSDATLIVVRDRELSGGTAFARFCAEKHRRPLLVICAGDGVSQSAAALAKFIKQHNVSTLNVAGPRESQEPGLGKFVMELLEAALLRGRTTSRSSLPVRIISGH